MAKKQCMTCKEENSMSARICASCGSSLSDSLVVGKEEPSGYILGGTCPKCGEKMQPNERNCKYCGHFTAKTQPANTPSHTSHSTYSYSSQQVDAAGLLYFVTFLLPILGILIGGVYTATENVRKQEVGKGLIKFGLVMFFIYALITAICLFIV